MSLKNVFAAAAAMSVALAFAVPAVADDDRDPMGQAVSKTALALIPYEQPGSTDPYAAPVTVELNADLTKAGFVFKRLDPINHFEAVSHAAKICADNGVAGLLIPEGRYEQTFKSVYAGVLGNVQRYNTLAMLRVDEVSCDGVVRLTVTLRGDAVRSGMQGAGFSHIGSDIDKAFRDAAYDAVRTFAPAAIVAYPIPAAQPAAVTPPTVTTYALLPLAQPNIADPRFADITQSLRAMLAERKVAFTMSPSIDDLTAVATAPQICAEAGAQAILVPEDRVEQSGRSHAQARLTVLDCSGAFVRSEMGENDYVSGGVNIGSQIVAVSEHAFRIPLDTLFGPGPASAGS